MTPATTAPAEAKPAETKPASRNPWWWVPSLYFSEGIPYVIVMTMSVVMYKRLGISNTDIALYTSWLYLPWVIKPLWSPFVDITRTKRFWVVAMQFLVSLGAGAGGLLGAGLGLLQVVAVPLLDHGLRVVHARHRGGRLLHARAFQARAGLVGGPAQHVLPHSHDRRQRLARRAGGRARKQERPAAGGDPRAGERQSAGRLRLGPRRGQAPGPGGRTARDRPAEPRWRLPWPIAVREDAKAVISQAKAWNRQHGFVAEDNPAPAKADSELNLVVDGERLRPLRRLPGQALSQTVEEPGCGCARRGQRRRDLSLAIEAAACRPGGRGQLWPQAPRHRMHRLGQER